jgi:hypothetical protein
MAEFFKTSKLWVVDFLHDGRARRWFKAFAPGVDVAAEMRGMLAEWYGNHAQLVAVREANEVEETQYLRGEEEKNAYCPTDRPVKRASKP